MGAGKVFAGGVVAGSPVVVRTTVAMGAGVKLTIGFTAGLAVVGEWAPRMPATFSPTELALKFNGALGRLLLAAAARPGFLISGWRVPLPPASMSRSGGPLRRRRARRPVTNAC